MCIIPATMASSSVGHHPDEDQKFLVKINQGSEALHTNILRAHKKGLLNLADKKRCCLLVWGCALADFDKRVRWTVTDDEIVMKHQWFHSALGIYIFISRPASVPKRSFIDSITSAKARKVIKNISRTVLACDSDGVECIRTIDSGAELALQDDMDDSTMTVGAAPQKTISQN